MKKILLVSICSALFLSVFSTGFTLNNITEPEKTGDHAVIVSNPTPVVQHDTYASTGLDLIKKMDTLAESKNYVSIMSSSDNLNVIISAIGKASYDTPKAIYKSVIPKGSVSKAFSKPSAADLSSDITNIVENKFIISIPNQINAENGTSELAAAALLSLDESFSAEDITEPEIYVYLYDNDYSAIVTLIPGMDGAVSATSRFVKTKQFENISSADDLSSLFDGSLSIEGLSFKEVSL
ncbi:MAG: hypothetical protein VB119_06765 [Candidatus Metalachnospira sp.]|nr:hypothetical protein [Candidatus Metalachnospira sp.]